VAITIREEQDAASNSAAITFTTGAGMLATDKLVLIQANDFYTAGNLTTPSGTAGGTWTLRHTADGGTDQSHAKVWTADAAGSGARTVNVNSTTTDEERYAALFVLAGAASGIDGAASTPNGASSVSHVAPSVTPTSGQSDDLLICLFHAGIAGAGEVNYTMPGSMTAYTERDVTFATFRAGSELLASSGATGTRTATASVARAFLAVSVLVKSEAAAPAALWRRRLGPNFRR
jgi:hypothetical protein